MFIARVTFDRNVSLCLKPTVSPNPLLANLNQLPLGYMVWDPLFAISDQTAQNPPKKLGAFKWAWIKQTNKQTTNQPTKQTNKQTSARNHPLPGAKLLFVDAIVEGYLTFSKSPFPKRFSKRSRTILISGQIAMIPKPELRSFWRRFPYFSPPFGVIPNRWELVHYNVIRNYPNSTSGTPGEKLTQHFLKENLDVLLESHIFID